MISVTGSATHRQQISNREPVGYMPGSSATDLRSMNAHLPEGRAAKVRHLEPGESLFLQDDPVDSVYVLREGWAFLCQDMKDGRRQILDFVLPGDLVGLGVVEAASYGVETLTACSFASYSRGAFFDSIGRQPALGVSLVRMLAAVEARALEHVTSLGRRTARERTAHLLLELVKRLKRADGKVDMKTLDLPLMLSHVADALGLASETVCRCLSGLRKDGILVLRERRLQVLDLYRLAEEAGLSDHDEFEQDVPPSRARRIAA
jgi:CRP-like cAMP-binding protein